MNFEYLYYKNLFKNNYRKGIHTLNNILSSDSLRESLINSYEGMHLIYGFNYRDPDLNAKQLLTTVNSELSDEERSVVNSSILSVEEYEDIDSAIDDVDNLSEEVFSLILSDHTTVDSLRDNPDKLTKLVSNDNFLYVLAHYYLDDSYVSDNLVEDQKLNEALLTLSEVSESVVDYLDYLKTRGDYTDWLKQLASDPDIASAIIKAGKQISDYYTVTKTYSLETVFTDLDQSDELVKLQYADSDYTSFLNKNMSALLNQAVQLENLERILKHNDAVKIFFGNSSFADKLDTVPSEIIDGMHKFINRDNALVIQSCTPYSTTYIDRTTTTNTAKISRKNPSDQYLEYDNTNHVNSGDTKITFETLVFPKSVYSMFGGAGTSAKMPEINSLERLFTAATTDFRSMISGAIDSVFPAVSKYLDVSSAVDLSNMFSSTNLSNYIEDLRRIFHGHMTHATTVTSMFRGSFTGNITFDIFKDDDLSKVTSLSNMISDKNNNDIAVVDFSGCDLSGVTSMNGIDSFFLKNGSTSSYSNYQYDRIRNFSGANLSNLTSIKMTGFYQTDDVHGVYISFSDCDLSKVTDLDFNDNYGNGLSVDFSKANLSGLKNIKSNAFSITSYYDNRGTTYTSTHDRTVDFTEANLSNLKSIDSNAFKFTNQGNSGSSNDPFNYNIIFRKANLISLSNIGASAFQFSGNSSQYSSYNNYKVDFSEVSFNSNLVIQGKAFDNVNYQNTSYTNYDIIFNKCAFNGITTFMNDAFYWTFSGSSNGAGNYNTFTVSFEKSLFNGEVLFGKSFNMSTYYRASGGTNIYKISYRDMVYKSDRLPNLFIGADISSLNSTNYALTGLNYIVDATNANFENVTNIPPRFVQINIKDGGSSKDINNIYVEVDFSGAKFPKVMEINENAFYIVATLGMSETNYVNYPIKLNLSDINFESLTTIKPGAFKLGYYTAPTLPFMYYYDLSNISAPLLETYTNAFMTSNTAYTNYGKVTVDATGTTDIDFSYAFDELKYYGYDINVIGYDDYSLVPEGKLEEVISNYNTRKSKYVSLRGADLSEFSDMLSLPNYAGIEEYDLSNCKLPASLNFNQTTYYTTLKKVNLSNCDLTSVTNLDTAIKSVTSIKILDVSGAKFGDHNMANFINNDTGIQEIYFNNCDLTNVINFQSVFTGCTGINKVCMNDAKLPTGFITTINTTNWITKASLQLLDMSGIDLSEVTDIMKIFGAATTVTKAVFNGCDLSGLTNLNVTLSSCSLDMTNANLSNISSISLPTKNTTSSEYVFDGADLSSVTALSFKGTDTSTNRFACKVLSFKGARFTSKLNDINEMITDNSYVNERLDFSDCDFSGVTSIANGMIHLKSTNATINNIYLNNLNLGNLVDNPHGLVYLETPASNYITCKEFDCSGIDIHQSTYNKLIGPASRYTKFIMRNAKINNDISYDLSNFFKDSSSYVYEIDMTGTTIEDCSSIESLCDSNSNLTKCIIDVDITNCTSMKNGFYNCKVLEELELVNKFKDGTFNVCTDMSQMFYYCSKLNFGNLDMSGAKFPLVTDINNMFYYCTNLTGLDASNVDLSTCTTVDNLFSSAGINYVNFSNANLRSITSDGFKTLLSSMKGDVNLSEADLSGVTTLEAGTTKVSTQAKSLDMSGINLSNCTSMKEFVKDNSSLTEVNLDNADLSSCTTMQAAFQGSGNSDEYVGTNGMRKFSMKGTKLPLCSIFTDMLTYSNVGVIDFGDFRPDIANNSDINTSGMFRYCRGLNTIYCSQVWVASTSTGMFDTCDQLVGSVGFDSEHTDISYANPYYGYFTMPEE